MDTDKGTHGRASVLASFAWGGQRARSNQRLFCIETTDTLRITRMTTSPDRHLVRSNLKLSPYLAFIGVTAAVVLAFWVPFFPVFLSVAGMVGALTFALHWLGVRRRASLGFIGTILTIVACMASRRLLLPRGMTTLEDTLAGAQFLAVWMLVFAGLQILFRARLTRALDERAA